MGLLILAGTSIHREISAQSRKTFHRQITSRDARIATIPLVNHPPPPCARIEPCRIHCRWIIRDTTRRGKAFTNHRYFRVATGAVYYRGHYRGSRTPAVFLRERGPQVMTERAFTAPLRIRIFVQLCVTSGHYRVSRRGSLPDLSPYVVEQNDLEYPQVSRSSRRAFASTGNPRRFSEPSSRPPRLK